MTGILMRLTALTLVLGLTFTTGCPRTNVRMKQPKAEVQQDETALDQPAQEQFRKKIAALNVPVYPGAELMEIRKKTKDSSLVYAAYVLPDPDKKKLDAARKFYAKQLKKTLTPIGWEAVDVSGNVLMYRKGFEIFYVELSTAIVMPDKKMLRIAIHYGK